MKAKALRKHSLHEEKTALVLLKLFISSNERCHITDHVIYIYGYMITLFAKITVLCQLSDYFCLRSAIFKKWLA